MPLLVMCGYPRSGKTRRVQDLVEHLKQVSPEKQVTVISDDDISGFSRVTHYTDSTKEKLLRGGLKSMVQTQLSPGRLVILDSLNYVKGFRYELYCIVKASRTTHCILWCDSSPPVDSGVKVSNSSSEHPLAADDASESSNQIRDLSLSNTPGSSLSPGNCGKADKSLDYLTEACELETPIRGSDNAIVPPNIPSGNIVNGDNSHSLSCGNSTSSPLPTTPIPTTPLPTVESPERSDEYPTDVISALKDRFEPPNDRQRWDSPLIVIQQGEATPTESIISALYERAASVPNRSTESPALQSTSFLYDLDKVTQEVVQAVGRAVGVGGGGLGAAEGSTVKVPGCEEPIHVRSHVTLPGLQKIRRQFLTYMKSHPLGDPNSVRNVFVQYLNSHL